LQCTRHLGLLKTFQRYLVGIIKGGHLVDFKHRGKSVAAALDVFSFVIWLLFSDVSVESRQPKLAVPVVNWNTSK
jgi:hypothetical protein